jgi:hypothetical protein
MFILSFLDRLLGCRFRLLPPKEFPNTYEKRERETKKIGFMARRTAKSVIANTKRNVQEELKGFGLALACAKSLNSKSSSRSLRIFLEF